MRLIIVSNRLPVQLPDMAKGKNVQKNIGGLATGIAAYTREIEKGNTVFSEFLWVGWPGVIVQPGEAAAIREHLVEHHHCLPVFLGQDAVNGFYNNYCNKVLWPLFHYFPEYVEITRDDWMHYKQANYIFYEALKEALREDDFIWIHDYHLMLLPGLLRHIFPKIKINFFLHIPFPAFDVFRQLPGAEQEELLRGLLGADVIGVHIAEYKKHLLETYHKVLGLRNEDGAIRLKQRTVEFGVFPMGVHHREIFDLALSADCMEQKKIVRKNFYGNKIILSIDRLDYTKGIANRLHAFYELLVSFPEWRNKVSLLLIVAPSRREIHAYAKIKNEIDQLVGRINGEFGNCFWVPVVYQSRQFDLSELCVLYGASDIALVTPLRDGMNLVAKEFIAASDSKNGVLILSEFAGAALELPDAILVNPYSHKDLARAIHTGLTLTTAEKQRRNKIMKQQVTEYNVLKWAADLTKATILASEGNKKTTGRYLDAGTRQEIVTAYKKASKCLLFFDYDGTLSPFVAQPDMHVPEKSTIRLLHKISGVTNGKIVIISGRNKAELDKWFRGLEVDIGAEFGTWLRSGDKWKLNGAVSTKWKSNIRELIMTHSARVPQSYLEEKEYTLIWDHRMAMANTKEKHIASFMETVHKSPFAGGELSFLNGRNNLIVRCKGADKGAAAKHWLAKDDYDFIFAVGDDDTDEELFEILPEHAVSLKVGAGDTCAKYYVPGQSEVIDLVNMMIAAKSS